MAGDAPFADGQDVAAILVKFAQDVAGNEQRHALRVELAKQLREVAACFGVESAGGLIEQQHFWGMHDGLPNGYALALAAREVAGQRC